MCDHGRLNYRWMNRQDRVDAAAWCARAACSRRPTGTSRSRAAAALLAGKRAFVLASPISRTKRCSCSAGWSSRPAARARSASTQGAEAPLPGVEDLALRADRAANVAGAELLGFTRSDTPLGGLGDGDVLDRRRRGARRRSTPRTPRRRGAVDRRSARRCRRGRATRRRRAADRELRRGRRARSRTCAAACSASCRRRRRRASRGRAGSCSATCSRAMGEATRLLRSPARCSTRSPRRTPAFAGMSYDALGLRGRRSIAGATAGAAA